MNASYSGGEVTVSFTGVESATWYYIWIGTANAATTNHLMWYSSTDLNCQNGGACTVDIPLALTAGTYYVAVQSAGPGGFSTGGLVGNGFQVDVDGFIVPATP
jgi:hypothetical protein